MVGTRLVGFQKCAALCMVTYARFRCCRVHRWHLLLLMAIVDVLFVAVKNWRSRIACILSNSLIEEPWIGGKYRRILASYYEEIEIFTSA